MFAAPLLAILHAADHLDLNQAQLLAGINIDAETLSLPDERFPVKQYYVARLSNHLRDYLNIIPRFLKLRSDIGEISVYRDGDSVELRWE